MQGPHLPPGPRSSRPVRTAPTSDPEGAGRSWCGAALAGAPPRLTSASVEEGVRRLARDRQELRSYEPSPFFHPHKGPRPLLPVPGSFGEPLERDPPLLPAGSQRLPFPSLWPKLRHKRAVRVENKSDGQTLPTESLATTANITLKWKWTSTRGVARARVRAHRLLGLSGPFRSLRPRARPGRPGPVPSPDRRPRPGVDFRASWAAALATHLAAGELSSPRL